MTTYIPKWTVGMLCFITAAVLSICWLLASICDPSWSFGTMRISDLGTSEVESAKVLFNVGFCILGGALLILIGALYLFTKKSRLLHVLYALLIIAIGIDLICIGFNPVDTREDVHMAALRIALLFMAVIYILTTAEVWLDKNYFAASVLTTGFILCSLLAIAQMEEVAEVTAIIFFIILLVYYGIVWCTKKTNVVKNLYDNEVRI